MTVTLALAGDTMLGRKVAETLTVTDPPPALLAPAVAELTAAADLFLLNLECCISERGERWPDPDKPFFFRAPPLAAGLLAGFGVDAVTLANNHALDYGTQALLDTTDHLRAAGIAWVGAGPDVAAARRPLVLEAGGLRVGVLAFADHPPDYAAGPASPGIAYADLSAGLPRWVSDAVADLEVDVVLVTPHWGPNMSPEPVRHVRRAASGLLAAGADLVAGHSAHVFHGVHQTPDGTVLYDLGDFIDDYAVHQQLRNDLGLLWLVELDEHGAVRVEAVPLVLELCFTGLAQGDEARWVRDRFVAACAALGSQARERGGRLHVELREQASARR